MELKDAQSVKYLLKKQVIVIILHVNQQFVKN